MNRRSFSLFALLPFLQSKRVGGPNPGDCFRPFVRGQDTIARDMFRLDLMRWCKVASLNGVRTAYATLDPQHEGLLPTPPLLKLAGVKVWVMVSDTPLPPHPTLGEVGWVVTAECGQRL